MGNTLKASGRKIKAFETRKRILKIRWGRTKLGMNERTKLNKYGKQLEKNGRKIG